MTAAPAPRLKIDGGITSQLGRIPEDASILESQGYDGCWSAEINHDPFLPLTLAAEHTSRIELGTSIAVAFARNPMTVANVGWDLQAYSGGRFILGLGSQIQAHIEKRFSMPWSHPVRRMREFVLALRERRDFQLMCPVFVVTGEQETELQAAAAATRKQIAFYGSTPAYRKVLEMHGWGDLQDELHLLSLQGRWDAMGSLIDDEILDAFAVVAPIDELAATLRGRCDGVIDRVLLGFPKTVSAAKVAAILHELRTP